MAGIIKGYWESAKNQLVGFVDICRVAVDLEKGGCLDAGIKAMVACNHQFQSNIETDVPAEVDVDECVRATAAFRRCMQGKPDAFREYIAAMDKGIEEDERMLREPELKVEQDGPRFRWWTGMRNT